MEQIMKSLNDLHRINSAYALSNDAVERLLSDAVAAKVCTPVIGRFSSGKSALLNTLLGYSRKLLKENITPETAVPTEITYSPDGDSVFVFRNDGAYKDISISDFRELETDANTVGHIRLNLRNSFLEEIPDVMLVDMPGFESGFEVHNKAIDSYLPQSLAYILAFPADDMIVRSSVGNILKELCLHDIPICVVITKYDKHNDEFESTFDAMKASLRRFIGEREITYCVTSSYSGDAEELEEFLKKIQEQSQEILAANYKNAVLSEVDVTENYLKATLKGSEMSESELDEQETRYAKQFDSLNAQFSKEKEDFDSQVAGCIEEIKSDVQQALEAEEATFIAMAMNNQDVNERLNSVVRSAVTASVKKRFIPRVEKYLKRVANCINSESLGDIKMTFSFNAENVSKGVVSTAVAAAAAIIIGGPLLGGIIAAVIAFANKMKGERKREEIKNQLKMKLNSEVYPQVLREVGTGIEIAVIKQIRLINTSIEDEIISQRMTLKKAMEDVREKMSEERELKENLAIDIKADLERLQVIRSEV